MKTLLRRLVADKLILTATVVLVVILVLSIGANLWFQTDPNASHVTRRLLAPSWLGGDGGLLGTDQLGRPLWIRILYGLRTSFLVAVLAVLVGAGLGSLVGVVAGYFGGAVDSLLMRLADVQLALPALLLAMTVVATAGGGVTVLVLVLGLNSWMVYARVLRGLVLRQMSTDLVLAEVSLGARPRRIMGRHLLPACAPQLVAVATLELARLMLGEATLSFLGFGVQTPTVSIGTIMSEGRNYLATQWWVATFAGVVLGVTVLCTNLLGNWLERSTGAGARRVRRRRTRPDQQNLSTIRRAEVLS
jgi:peptide/nickel transport system permease protein